MRSLDEKFILKKGFRGYGEFRGAPPLPPDEINFIIKKIPELVHYENLRIFLHKNVFNITVLMSENFVFFDSCK